MKELKVYLSPSFSEESWKDEVSGIEFKQERNITIHSLRLEEEQLTGIANALRLCILKPYDVSTKEYFKGYKIPAKKSKSLNKVETTEESVVVETEKVEIKEVKKPATAKKTATKKKAAPKKEQSKTEE